MPSSIDDDPPISHAIAVGWAEFAEKDLHRRRHRACPGAIAFHFGALYVLQLLEEVAVKSTEAAALALDMLTAALDDFIKTRAVAVQ